MHAFTNECVSTIGQLLTKKKFTREWQDKNDCNDRCICECWSMWWKDVNLHAGCECALRCVIPASNIYSLYNEYRKWSLNIYFVRHHYADFDRQTHTHRATDYMLEELKKTGVCVRLCLYLVPNEFRKLVIVYIQFIFCLQLLSAAIRCFFLSLSLVTCVHIDGKATAITTHIHIH